MAQPAPPPADLPPWHAVRLQRVHAEDLRAAITARLAQDGYVEEAWLMRQRGIAFRTLSLLQEAGLLIKPADESQLRPATTYREALRRLHAREVALEVNITRHQSWLAECRRQIADLKPGDYSRF